MTVKKNNDTEGKGYVMESVVADVRTRVAVFVLIGANCFLAGCASTDMHSFVDPDFRGHAYQNLMISVQIDKLDQRDDAETIFTKEFDEIDGRCLRALDVLPPTREYTDAQFQRALKDAGVDGVLIVRMTEYYEDEYYVPPSSSTYTTGTLSAHTYYHGNTASTYGTASSTSHTTTSGGYTYTKPRIRHEAQLWDVTTGRMAWIGGTFTKGNAYARFKHLMSSVAEETCETLEKEGLVHR